MTKTSERQPDPVDEREANNGVPRNSLRPLPAPNEIDIFGKASKSEVIVGVAGIVSFWGVLILAAVASNSAMQFAAYVVIGMALWVVLVAATWWLLLKD